MNPTTRNLVIIGSVLIVINLAAVWLVLYFQMQKVNKQASFLESFATHIAPAMDAAGSQTSSNQQPSFLSALTGGSSSTTTFSPLGEISWSSIMATMAAQLAQNTATIQDLNQRLTQLENAQSKTGSNNKSSSFASVKETVLFLGSGSTNNRDWTDVSGAQTDINLDNYSHIKSIRFEAGLSIIGGEAHARLVNKTTGAVFYDSELSNNTSQGMWLSSPVLSLPSGNATYGVQLKSTSGETANLIGARIRITVQ